MRSVHPGLLYGALAVLFFCVGILAEPLLEPAAEAGTSAGALTLHDKAPLNSGATHKDALAQAPVSSSDTPPTEAAAGAELSATEPGPQPSQEAGVDPEQGVKYFELKNLPAESGQAEPARDVDMIDEPGLPADDGNDSTAASSSPAADAPGSSQVAAKPGNGASDSATGADPVAANTGDTSQSSQ